MSPPIRGWGDHFDFRTSKNTNLVNVVASFVEFYLVVAEKNVKMSQPIRCQSGRLGLPSGPKNTQLVEDIETSLTVGVLEFYSMVRERITKNESANQRPG